MTKKLEADLSPAFQELHRIEKENKLTSKLLGGEKGAKLRVKLNARFSRAFDIDAFYKDVLLICDKSVRKIKSELLERHFSHTDAKILMDLTKTVTLVNAAINQVNNAVTHDSELVNQAIAALQQPESEPEGKE